MDGKQKSVAAITQELQNCSEEALIALCSNLRTDPRKSVQLLAEKAMKRLEKEKKELERVQGMIDFEREIAGSTIYCGIDEAGRGPLAGPVVAAAVIMPRDGKIPYVNDSKQVSEKKREQLYEQILKEAVSYGVGIVDAKRIDEINILQATYEAMREAVSQLTLPLGHVLADAVGFDWKKVVLSHQTHTTNVRLVTEKDAGKGTVRERDYTDVDGLITNEPGLPLVTFYADCVPLYFADPKNKAIGLSHSGWRGTVGRMGEKTLKAMNKAFGTQPQDVIAAIGPSICGDCFEVGPEVVEEFAKTFSKKKMEAICHAGRNDRSYLDLWRANRIILEEAGVQPQNISVTNICTRCNPDLLYSHRIMGAQRGNLAAVLMIKE